MKTSHFSYLITGAAMLALSSGAIAENTAKMKALSPEQRKEIIKNMTPEERQHFMESRKAKWEGLSDAEKVKLIEERRAEYQAKRDAEWEGLSDAEKIKRAEERMQQKKKRH
jgi:hypothetical protein